MNFDEKAGDDFKKDDQETSRTFLPKDAEIE
jgi:hypothetical protein